MSHDVQDAQFRSIPDPAAWISSSQVLAGADTPASRLSALRRAAGYDSAAEAARGAGVSDVTFQQHENGTRNISPLAAERYSRFFGVPKGLLLYGEQQAQAISVPVVGAVGAGGVVSSRRGNATLPSSLQTPPFPGSNLQALVVQGEDLYPAYRPGDVLLYAKLAHPNAALIEGRECVVETTRGATLLRVVHAQPPERWMLVAHHGLPTHGVRLRSASPVLWVQRQALRPVKPV